MATHFVEIVGISDFPGAEADGRIGFWTPYK